MKKEKRFGILRLYGGASGQAGYYNLQEMGLARALVKRGYEVVIFLLQKGGRISEERLEEHMTMVHLPARIIGNQSCFPLSLLDHYPVEILQIQSDNQIFAPSVMKYCRGRGIKFYNYIGVVESHSVSKWKRSLMNLLFRRNLKYLKQSAVFAKTDAVREQLDSLGVPNVIVAPVGLDTEVIPVIPQDKNDLREKLQLPIQKKLLIFVGRLEEYKKPLHMIALMEQLPEEYDLILIGKGSQKEKVFDKIRSGHLEKRIHYLEAVPNKEIHQYLKAADYFINLNEKEIFGMGILEAMYQGCVVIAIKAPGPCMMIEDGKSGFLVEEIGEIPEKLKQGSQIMGEYAAAKVRKSYTWDETCSRILQQIGEDV